MRGLEKQVLATAKQWSSQNTQFIFSSIFCNNILVNFFRNLGDTGLTCSFFIGFCQFF